MSVQTETVYTFYGDTLVPAVFDGHTTLQPDKIFQPIGDPELIVQKDAIFGGQGNLAGWREAGIDAQRMNLEAIRVLHNDYGFHSPGVIVSVTEQDPNPNDWPYNYVAAGRVQGTNFVHEHLEGYVHGEYNLENIPEAVTVATMGNILRYFEDVLDGKVARYNADLRLGNLMYGRLEGDYEDHVFMFDFDNMFFVDASTEGYHGVTGALDNRKATSDVKRDIMAMVDGYKKDFPELQNRFDDLLERTNSMQQGFLAQRQI